MREIKFRAWDKEMKVMHIVDRIQFDVDEIDVTIRKDEGYEEFYAITFSEIELMQYTGLKDKSGVEIYDGDICTDGISTIRILWVDNHQWGCEVIKGSALTKGLTFPLWQWDKCERNDNRVLEVIGNIYDNPELLEVKV